MKKLLVMTAAAGLLVVASIEEASARYRGGGSPVASVVADFAVSASAAVIVAQRFGPVLSVVTAIVAHGSDTSVVRDTSVVA